jgi:hypothetical protein
VSLEDCRVPYVHDVDFTFTAAYCEYLEGPDRRHMIMFGYELHAVKLV